MLVAACGRAGQEPQDALDDEVGDEPAESAACDRVVHVGCFEEVRDQSVDREAAAGGFAKDLEAVEDFGEGEEAGAEAHGY